MTKHHILALAAGVAVGFYFSIYISGWTGISPMIPAGSSTGA